MMMIYGAPSRKNQERLQRHKDIHFISHTHTHYKIIHALLVMGWYNEKKTTHKYAEEKRWAFSFDLKEKSEDECLKERRREFQT